MTTPSFDAYSGTGPENYERYFVPAIGLPLAVDLIAAAEPAEGERVLDVACGTGVVARLAADRVGKPGQVEGLDANPDMLAIARMAAPEGVIRWHEASAEAMPLPDDRYDVVLCQMGLQFFRDRHAALSEMRRVTSPGGRLALNLPGPTPELFGVMRDTLARHVSPDTAGFVDAVFALHEPAQVETELSAAGYAGVVTTPTRKTLRLPPPTAFFWQYVHSTPLAAAVAATDERSRDALGRDIVAGLDRFTKGGGMVLPRDAGSHGAQALIGMPRLRQRRETRAMPMRCTRALIAGVLLSVAVPRPVAAQMVRGTARESEGNRPIAGARLFLISESGRAVDSTAADLGGRFRLTAPAAGVFAIHFQMDGWAAYTSERLRLQEGDTTTFDFTVPLVSNAALRQMSDVIANDARLQESLPEICGEELRPWEAGVLVGVVRARATREPVAGARVSITDNGHTRTTLSNERGVYVLCNVPLGPEVDVTVELPDGTTRVIPVEIRAGTISWYDLFIGKGS